MEELQCAAAQAFGAKERCPGGRERERERERFDCTGSQLPRP